MAAASWHAAAAYAINKASLLSYQAARPLVWGHEGPRKLTPLLWGVPGPWRRLLHGVALPPISFRSGHLTPYFPHLVKTYTRAIIAMNRRDTRNGVNGLFEPYGNKQVLTRVSHGPLKLAGEAPNGSIPLVKQDRTAQHWRRPPEAAAML